MKEGYTTIKDSKGERHDAPIIKAPYLKNLFNKTVEVGFADSKVSESSRERIRISYR
jgi:hypothetical protein